MKLKYCKKRAKQSVSWLLSRSWSDTEILLRELNIVKENRNEILLFQWEIYIIFLITSKDKGKSTSSTTNIEVKFFTL